MRRRRSLAGFWTGRLLPLGAALVLSCAVALASPATALATSSARHAAPAAGPAQPTGVAAGESDGDLTVAWNAVSGATGYRVLIRDITAKKKAFKTASWQQDPASSTPLADISFSDFTYGHKYAFEVVAKSAAGDSKRSAQATVTAVGIPLMLYSAAGTRAAYLGWQNAPGATSFRVFQYDNCAFDYAHPIRVTAKRRTVRETGGARSTWVDVTKLTNARCYDFVVSAYNSGNGNYAAASTPDTFLEPIGKPAWKSAKGGNRSGNLVWSRATGATEYQIYMSNQTKHKNHYKLAKTIKAAKGATQSLTIKGLVNGDKYGFFIVAFDNHSGETGTGVKSLTPRK